MYSFQEDNTFSVLVLSMNMSRFYITMLIQLFHPRTVLAVLKQQLKMLIYARVLICG